jgi:methylthioribose-1-phosphate isomerase
MQVVESVRWSPDGSAVRIIDQRLLPGQLVERDLRTAEDIAAAIRTLAVRGAPAIGIAAAMGLVVDLERHAGARAHELLARARSAAETLCATRPTAVNLSWALGRMLACAERAAHNSRTLLAALRAEATAILDEDRAMCHAIGRHGMTLLRDGARVLTHCNAGALATGGIGTALAPIYLAAERGSRIEVFVDETRPMLQGSRLTAWELGRAGIPVTVLADGMAGSLMAAGNVDLCLVGADRIAANGDVANKVGTYALAIVARYHDVPLYVAAPTSTIDATRPSGLDIPIEQRSPEELRQLGETPTAPPGVCVYNPAFDVTPAALVSAIITDRGIHRPPYSFSQVANP